MTNTKQQQPVVDPYARDEHSFSEPPQTLRSVLRHLGPGVILLGAIVGSGELIMTTKLGAEAGFFMLWLVFVSCFGKFVVQAELTRHTISSGKTFLQVFGNLPGPGFQRPAWLSLEWLATVLLLSFTGLGISTLLGEQRTALSEVGIGAAIVLGALISAAVIAAHRKRGKQGLFRMETTEPRPNVNWFMCLWLSISLLFFINGGAILGGAGQALQLAFPDLLGSGGSTKWAVISAVVCAVLLISGKYSVLEKISLGMVATFTVTTIVCTVPAAVDRLRGHACRPRPRPVFLLPQPACSWRRADRPGHVRWYRDRLGRDVHLYLFLRREGIRSLHRSQRAGLGVAAAGSRVDPRDVRRRPLRTGNLHRRHRLLLLSRSHHPEPDGAQS